MGIRSVDLNLLVALDALLTERHVTRAAERTAVGQAAMSASLARLRKHFGDPLLVREGRKLVATAFAESLVQPVREAIAAAEGALATRRTFDPARDRRTFTLLASDYVTLVLLRPLLAELAAEAPGVRISIVQLQEDFWDRLRNGRVDLVIAPTALADVRSRFPHRLLFQDRFVLAAGRDNTEIGEHLSAEELSEVPMLSYGAGPLDSLVAEQLERFGVNRRVEVTTENFLLSPFLLTDSRLVSVVQERLARQIADSARLRLVPLPFPVPPIVEAMYWNQSTTGSPDHRWLRGKIIDAASRLSAGVRSDEEASAARSPNLKGHGERGHPGKRRMPRQAA